MPAADRRRPAGVLLRQPVALEISTSAMASTDGVASATCRHRERSVIAMSSGSTDGAHSRNTVDGGGSSTTLSSALAAPSVSRSASSITHDLPPPRARPARRDLHDLAHLLDARWTALRARCAAHRRGCRPSSSCSARHSPHPGTPSDVHCSAAAKHSAATERPDPGGPVISHACVMVPDAGGAVRRITTRRRPPTRPPPAPVPPRAGPPAAKRPRSSSPTVVVKPTQPRHSRRSTSPRPDTVNG